jgi:hypothetical protein
MNEEHAQYSKLPARAIGWAGPARLWLGPDHLLQVTSTTINERYRRFYLRDIEALLIRRTKVRLILNIILGSGAGVSGALGGMLWWLAATVEFDPAAVALRVFGTIGAATGGVFLLLLFVNTLLGATCACFIQTPGGLDRLAAPARIRSARKLLQRLSPIIEAAQSGSADPTAPLR